MSIPNHYYEPESRLQQTDKLQHLVRFSDFVILIIGKDGVGKSALLDQLVPGEQQTQGRAVKLQLNETTDVTALLLQLTQAMDFEAVADNRQRLKQLHVLARQLREDGLPLILLIDDADFLTNNALELLVNFATLDKGVPPRVLLTGTEAFEERFRGLGLAEQLASHLHVERLEPFSAEESMDYVESLLPDGVELGKRQLAAVVERSQGLPGPLREQAVDLLRSSQLKAGGGARLPLPPRHISAAVVILLLVFGVAVWQYLPEDEAAPEVAERITLPLPVNREPAVQIEMIQEVQPAEAVTAAVSPVVSASVNDEAVAVESSATSAVSPTVSDTGSEPVPALQPEPMVESKPELKPEPKVEPKPQPVPAPKIEPTPQPEPKPAPTVEVKPEPKPAPSLESKPQLVQQSGGVAQQWLREDELLSWPEQGYTLQVMGARSEASVRDFIQGQAQPQRFYYFRTVFKGAPWHVVVYGQYADRGAATNAVAGLPEALRKLRPWARSIAGVKADINKKNQ